MQLEQRSRYNN